MESPQLLQRLELDPPDPDALRHFYLIDHFRKEAIGSIISRPSIIEALNKPRWMKSRGWIYVPESDQFYAIEISNFILNRRNENL